MRLGLLRLSLLGLGGSFAVGCGSAPDKTAAKTATVEPAPAKLDLAGSYASFAYTDCAGPAAASCLDGFVRSAGGNPKSRHNPRQGLQNPDPEWLLEWDKLPTAEGAGRYTYAAVALAAVERTWASHCHKKYDEFAKQLDEKLADQKLMLDRENQNPNPYDRLAGLLALSPAKNGSGQSTNPSFGPDAGPLRYEYEKALFAAFEQTKRTFLYTFEGYAPSDKALAAMKPRQEKFHERDLFCSAAAAGGVAGVDPFPDTTSWSHDVRRMVKRTVSPERLEVLKSREADLQKQVQLHFAKAKVPNPQLPPGVREYTLKDLKTFARDGKAASLARVETKSESTASKRVQVDEVARVGFTDWPSGVVLEPGDTVSFYGREVRVKDTVIVSTKQLEHINRDFDLEGLHVTSVTTKGGTLKYFR